MPTYAYRCNACGNQFEVFQSIKSDPVAECPRCKKSTTARLISGGGGLLFKGGGFYITDYRSDAYKESAKKDEAAQAPQCGQGACAACTPETTAASS